MVSQDKKTFFKTSQEVSSSIISSNISTPVSKNSNLDPKVSATTKSPLISEAPAHPKAPIQIGTPSRASSLWAIIDEDDRNRNKTRWESSKFFFTANEMNSSVTVPSAHRRPSSTTTNNVSSGRNSVPSGHATDTTVPSGHRRPSSTIHSAHRKPSFTAMNNVNKVTKYPMNENSKSLFSEKNARIDYQKPLNTSETKKDVSNILPNNRFKKTVESPLREVTKPRTSLGNSGQNSVPSAHRRPWSTTVNEMNSSYNTDFPRRRKRFDPTRFDNLTSEKLTFRSTNDPDSLAHSLRPSSTIHSVHRNNKNIITVPSGHRRPSSTTEATPIAAVNAIPSGRRSDTTTQATPIVAINATHSARQTLRATNDPVLSGHRKPSSTTQATPIAAVNATHSARRTLPDPIHSVHRNNKNIITVPSGHRRPSSTTEATPNVAVNAVHSAHHKPSSTTKTEGSSSVTTHSVHRNNKDIITVPSGHRSDTTVPSAHRNNKNIITTEATPIVAVNATHSARQTLRDPVPSGHRNNKKNITVPSGHRSDTTTVHSAHRKPSFTGMNNVNKATKFPTTEGSSSATVPSGHRRPSSTTMSVTNGSATTTTRGSSDLKSKPSKDNSNQTQAKKVSKATPLVNTSLEQTKRTERGVFKTNTHPGRGIKHTDRNNITNKQPWKKEFSSKKDKKSFFANLVKRKMSKISSTKVYFKTELSSENEELYKDITSIRKTMLRKDQRYSKGKERSIKNQRLHRDKKKIAGQFRYHVSLRVGPNNIFVNASTLKSAKTLISESAGTYKVGISKKKVKHVYSIILNKFYFRLRKIVRKRGIIFKVVCPTKIKKQVVKTILHAFKYNNCIVNVVAKKCFNGCRPPKKIRKKRQPRLRLFK